VYCVDCEGEGKVYVVDGAADSVVAIVAVGWDPFTICYNPISNKVYCGSLTQDYVKVIDGATDRVIATVTAGRSPHPLFYNPTNDKVYCANSGYYNNNDSTVTVIDGATNRVDTTIVVGVWPMDFAWSPVQNRVYVANNYSSSISVLRDSIPPGIEEALKPQASPSKPLPTIVRGVLVLPVSPRPRVSESPCLLDACGRKVLDLKSGANDVRALAPGVYFLREVQAQAQAQAVRKVVVTK
jgi:YVTN family beta-propeller protein